MIRLLERIRSSFFRSPQRSGRAQEDLAARELAKRGLRILERNVRTRRGEIDIVAQDRDCLVIVEVKSLKNPPKGFSPAEHLGIQKRKRLIRLGREFCLARGLRDLPVRYDFVSVVERENGAEVEIFERAFDASGRWA